MGAFIDGTAIANLQVGGVDAKKLYLDGAEVWAKSSAGVTLVGHTNWPHTGVGEIPVPAGALAGDIGMMTIASKGNSNVSVAGWALVTKTPTNTDFGLWLFSRTMTGAEGATATVSGAYAYYAGSVHVVRGASAIQTPTLSFDSYDNDGQLTAPGITAAAGSLVLDIYAARQVNPTAPSTPDDIIDQGFMYVDIDHNLNVPAGPTGDKNATFTGAGYTAGCQWEARI